MTIHHVFANKSNIGDWLCAKGIQSLLSLKVTEHLCDKPFAEKTLSELSKLSQNDFILIGGGGLFMDYFMPFWRGFKEISKRVPFIIWGAGYCDLKRKSSRPALSLIKEIVSRSRICIVRDELTRNYLKSCRIPAPVPCPSIAAVEAPQKKGFGILHANNYTTAGANIYKSMDRICRDFAQRTGRIYRQTNNRIEPERKKDLQSTLLRYIKSDLVVSSGLHGCIIALAMGRKVLAVSGDRKIDSFMKSAGLDDWILSVDEIKRLPGLLSTLHKQKKRISFIEHAINQNQKVADRVRKIINARRQ